jgi:hypothetical protein
MEVKKAGKFYLIAAANGYCQVNDCVFCRLAGAVPVVLYLFHDKDLGTHGIIGFGVARRFRDERR